MKEVKMPKQTAVEWLIEQLNNVRPTQICSIETIKEWCEQAKEMEKDKIENAYLQGFGKCDHDGIMDFNEYWEETYGGQDV